MIVMVELYKFVSFFIDFLRTKAIAVGGVKQSLKDLRLHFVRLISFLAIFKL
jgi:hypothetical protein